MSKKNRQEFSQARNQQSDKAAFIAAASQYKRRSPPQTPEQIAQTERAQRTAQEQSAAQAVRDWPGSLAERRGFEFARLTDGNHGMAVAASRVYGFFGALLFMKGFLAALGPAAYERGER